MDATGLELLDHIYDAALDPALWPRFIESFAAGYPGGQGVMYTVDPGTARVVLANWDPAWTRAYNTHFDQVNPWVPRMSTRPAGVANSAEQMMAPEAFRRTEYFNDFLRPQGFGTGVGATILRTGTRVVGVSVLFRGDVSEPTDLERLAFLVPHLRRAMDVNAALARTTLGQQASSAVLDQVDQPVVVVDADARVLLCNRSAERFLAGGALASHGAGDLRRKVREAALEGEPGMGRVAGGWSRLPQPARLPGEPSEVQVLVTPLRGSADLLTALFPSIARAALLLISEPVAPQVPGGRELRRRYGLTSSEARVVLLLLEGKPPSAIAGALDLRVSTVRQYLKTVFDKTGTHSQVELMSLLHAR